MSGAGRNEYGLEEAGAIRVLVADNDPRVRRGLRALLEADPGVILVGEARTAQEVLERDRALQPAVILLDPMLPGCEDGLRLLHELCQQRRPVVAISMRGGLRKAALGAGARDFLEKGSYPELVLRALHAAAAGAGLSAIHPAAYGQAPVQPASAGRTAAGSAQEPGHLGAEAAENPSCPGAPAPDGGSVRP